MLKFLPLFILTFYALGFSAKAQTGDSRSGICNRTIGSIYGSPDSDERGYSLIANATNDGMFVAGTKDNQILLLEVDLEGEVRWSRTFDVFPGEEEFPFTIILDSDGMLAVHGTTGVISVGGKAFILRYDPQNHQVLWTKEYISSPNTDPDGIVQKGFGGNYLMANNLNFYSGIQHIDTEILEIDKNNGNVLPSFAKIYRLTNRESLLEIVYHENFIYGTGRYRDGGAGENFRNAIVKLSADDGSQVWGKLGHVGEDEVARLYGAHLLIDNNAIISGSYGDSAGLTTSDSDLYLQKTSLDGELIWIRRYELGGTNTFCLGIIRSGNGYIVMGSTLSPDPVHVMLKVDLEGNLVWSKTFLFPPFIEQDFMNPTIGGRAKSKVIQVGDQLIFTGYVTHTTGDNDMFIVRTNLEGVVNDPCTQDTPYPVIVSPVASPVFYDFQAQELQSTPEVNDKPVEGALAVINPLEECTLTEPITTTFDTTICQGTTFEGYSMTGTYNDLFITSEGCDSIRTLNLTVLVCQPECGGNSGGIYGTAGDDERGVVLVARAENDGFYLAGTKNDSVLIVRYDLNGHVIWARGIEIVPSTRETVRSMLLDSDGMIAVAGTSGNSSAGSLSYVFRYNPNTHQVLWSRSFNNIETDQAVSIIQKGSGGDYVFTNNVDYDVANHSDLQMFELDKNTGVVNPAFSKVYTLGGTEGLNETVYDGQFLYGTGRFKDGGTIAKMRNTITKLDPATGDEIWTRMGHVPQTGIARLYGTHLVVDSEKIISNYQGDPDGTSTTDTKIFLQRTTLDGELVWLKQYELPGLNDFCRSLIKSGEDYVMLVDQGAAPQRMYLIKVNADGDLLWAKTYNFPSQVVGLNLETGNLKLARIGNQYVFTASAMNNAGDGDIIVLQTDLNGNINFPCITSEAVTIPIETIEEPVFYEVEPDVTDFNFPGESLTTDIETTLLQAIAACFQADTVFTFIDTTICRGQSIEGYTTSGEYIDIFEAANGCDSIRTINLAVLGCDPIIHWGLEACESYMSNGSHMIFTEFVPDYPTILTCADVEADHVDMEPSPMSKHSCTPGVNGTVAMCIGSSPSCTYNPGEVTSLIFTFSVEVPQDSSVQITGFEFFEKAPITYNWIDGPSGPNNYPRFYGIRILKNGTEIFQQSGISTTGNWTLQRFDFLTDSLFRVEEDTDFRIELLPYCPVGNGAEVSAWDIDEIRIFGGCIPFITFPIIGGDVATRNGKLIPNTYLHLADNHNFDLITTTKTDVDGQYLFDDLRLHTSYFVQGYNNGNVLQGVSTLDLIMMQRHLLGITPLSTLHQLVAADINHNGSVTIIDIVELRKMLLGYYDEFPKNTSWRFGVLPQDFTGTDISAFQEVSSIEALQDGITIINFEGIKIGDVNEDIKLNLHGEPIIIRNVDKITFRIDDAPVNKGDAFTLEVTAENIDDLQGFQFALMCNDLSLVSVDGVALPLTDENFSFSNEGILRLSWNQDRSYPVVENEVLFTITFMASSTGMISNKISVQPHGLQPEAYTGSELKAHDLNIEFERAEQKSEINSLRIEPNQLTTQAAVKFALSTGGEAVINFFDLSGKLVYSIQKEYTAGDHTEHINAKDLLSGDGVIYCQLVCNGYTSIQKLVLLK